MAINMRNVGSANLEGNSTDKIMIDGVDVLKEIKELKQAVRELAECLMWCGGSNDFAIEGKARKGWEKGPMKILESQIVKRIMQEEPDA